MEAALKAPLAPATVQFYGVGERTLHPILVIIDIARYLVSTLVLPVAITCQVHQGLDLILHVEFVWWILVLVAPWPDIELGTGMI